MNKGKIVQVMGPVVDVVFEQGELPDIREALEVENNGKKCIMEVSQHLGNRVVRCIMLSASEGLQRDREVIATGSGIKVPVGDCTLGRLFNVLGETVDGGESLEDKEHWVIHRDPPSFEDQSPAVEILETGIKVIDLLAPYAKGGKVAAICAAPSVFAKLGFLKNRKATSYPSFMDQLDGAETCEDPVVVDGNVTTSRGLGTAVPFALSLIAQLMGEEKAQEVAESIVYRG